MSCSRLHELEPSAAVERLPRAVRALLPSLAAPLEGVRLAAGQALGAIITHCLDDAAVMGAVSLAGTDLMCMTKQAVVVVLQCAEWRKMGVALRYWVALQGIRLHAAEIKAICCGARAGMGRASTAPPAAVRVVAAIAEGLTARYRSAWPSMLPGALPRAVPVRCHTCFLCSTPLSSTMLSLTVEHMCYMPSVFLSQPTHTSFGTEYVWRCTLASK